MSENILYYIGYIAQQQLDENGQAQPQLIHNGLAHDYYSIWFNISAAFFISEKKPGVIKLKTHYFISNHVVKC
jgi:hypothetical protein